MRHHKKPIIKPQQGFALLITLIVVSVVISIGLTLLDLTIKQLRLATGSKDSESSFHAANAGVECVRYWRMASSTEFEVGDGEDVPVSCFGVPGQPVNKTDLQGSDDIYQYDFESSWAVAGAPRCSKVTMITISSPIDGNLTLDNIQDYIGAYPDDDTKVCEPGGRCTIISVQGYNRACSNINTIGTIQREVLLEL